MGLHQWCRAMNRPRRASPRAKRAAGPEARPGLRQGAAGQGSRRPCSGPRSQAGRHLLQRRVSEEGFPCPPPGCTRSRWRESAVFGWEQGGGCRECLCHAGRTEPHGWGEPVLPTRFAGKGGGTEVKPGNRGLPCLAQPRGSREAWGTETHRQHLPTNDAALGMGDTAPLPPHHVLQAWSTPCMLVARAPISGCSSAPSSSVRGRVPPASQQMPSAATAKPEPCWVPAKLWASAFVPSWQSCTSCPARPCRGAGGSSAPRGARGCHGAGRGAGQRGRGGGHPRERESLAARRTAQKPSKVLC